MNDMMAGMGWGRSQRYFAIGGIPSNVETSPAPPGGRRWRDGSASAEPTPRRVWLAYFIFFPYFSLSLSLFRRPLGVFFPLLFFSRLAAVLADSLVVARIPRFQSRRQFDRCRKERFFFEAKRSNQTVEEQCNDPILNLFFLFRLWRNAEGRQRWGPPKE